MKKLTLALIAVFCLTACGSLKQDSAPKNKEKKALILPPDVNSNKYSKKRN